MCQILRSGFRAQYADSIRDRKAEAKDKDWELIGTPFHRWARDNKTRLGLGTEAANIAFMTKNFPFFAKAYLMIQEASENYTPGLKHVFYNAHNGFTWQNTVLLAPLSISDKEDVVRKKIELVAAYLDIWIMRRIVNYIRVGYSSASYSMYLLCKDVRNKPLPSLVKILTKRLAEDNVTLEEAVDKGRHGLDEFNLNQWSRKYILHILARFASLAEELGGRSDQFDAYVDRTRKNPFDIEHIWSGKFSTHKKDFESENEFNDWRNHIGSLLLLPADINRSLQDKGFAHKRAKYASENLFAASLHEPAYSHQPKFKAAIKREGLAFKAYETLGKNEQLERRELVKQLAKLIWSPDHLQEIADE